MLVVFLLDTSASMNQRCANGLSLLDCAKSAVEHFHKVRSRDASCRVDRYMLVTCEDGPNCIKAVDKYPFTHFMRALKSIQARDLTNIGAAMQRIFSFLHVQRLAVDIDRFGQGRNPCSIDPTTIMLLTDGTELTTLAGVTQSLLQNGPSPVGADLSSQPFRWDQRVFATVLRIPSVSSAVLERSGPIPQNAPISGSQTALAMDTIISAFCEFTGGKCFVATSWKVLMQHTEVTATRLPPCVIVSFEHMPLPGSQTLPPQVQAACQRKMLLVRGGQAQQGHWPIPEAFWPDPAHPGIPPREPHPTIAYKAVDADPFIPTNFICDKYEIESNPIMGFLLKAPAAVCWQVYVRNSKGTNHGYGDPFGYLRLNRGGTTLTLVVLPYNYPVLWQLLEQGGKVPGTAKMPPLPQWRQDMERYCNSIPSYYGAPLRTALKRWGLSAHVVPEAMENSLIAGFVGTQLKRLKMQAKADLDEDMKRILTEQQLLGTTLAGATATLQGRTLPLMPSPSTAEAPPGFTSGMTSGAVNNVSGSVSAPQQARGMAHGDQTNGRKGWESLLPSGPSSTAGPPAVSGGFIGPVPVAGAAYGSGLGISNNDSSSSSNNVGIMKDITLFKNPFDVSRDQLLRQLRYLPIRIAVAMDARQNRRMERDTGKGKSSAISILAARIAAKEEDEARHSLPIEKMGDFNEALMKQQPPRNPFIDEQDRSKQQRTMFGNPYRQEKNDGADEAWLEGQGPGGPLFRGRKRRRRSESPGVSNSSLSGAGSAADGNSEAASANAEVTSPARTLPEAQGAEGLQGNSNPEGNKAIERPSDVGLSDSHDAAPVADSRGSPAPDSDMGDGGMDAQKNSFPSGADKQSGPTFLESSAAASERLDQTSGEATAGLEKLDSGSEEMSRSLRKRRVVVCTPSGTEKDRDEVINFLLTIVKALRYSKASNTQKLFELLSSPDFPVDKTNFLEQLILQAQRYNKVSVAKELVDYRNQLTTNAASVTVTVSERA